MGADGELGIGALAKRTGMSVSALRFYEAQGLLEPTGRTATGYRRYDAEAVARLEFIRQAKAVGLRLADIREMLWTPDGTADRQVVSSRISEALGIVAAQRDELARLEETLRRLYVLNGGKTPPRL